MATLPNPSPTPTQPKFNLIELNAIGVTPFQVHDKTFTSNDVVSVDSVIAPSPIIPDVYELQAQPGETINLALHSNSGDAGLELFEDSDHNGIFDPSIDQLTGISKNEISLDDAINYRAGGGTYFARVKVASGAADKVNYDLDVSATPQFAPSNLLPKEGNAGIFANGKLPPTLSGKVGGNNTSDVYSFVALSTSGQKVPAVLRLWSDLTSPNQIAMRLIQDKNQDGIVQDEDIIAKSSPSSIGLPPSFPVAQQLIFGSLAGSYQLQVYSTGVPSHSYSIHFQNHV